MNVITQNEKFNSKTTMEDFKTINFDDLRSLAMEEQYKCNWADIYIGMAIHNTIVFADFNGFYDKPRFLVEYEILSFLKKKELLLKVINQHGLYKDYLTFENDHIKWLDNNRGGYLHLKNKNCHLRLV
jgi:hypothetical protein